MMSSSNQAASSPGSPALPTSSSPAPPGSPSARDHTRNSINRVNNQNGHNTMKKGRGRPKTFSDTQDEELKKFYIDKRGLITQDDMYAFAGKFHISKTKIENWFKAFKSAFDRTSANGSQLLDGSGPNGSHVAVNQAQVDDSFDDVRRVSEERVDDVNDMMSEEPELEESKNQSSTNNVATMDMDFEFDNNPRIVSEQVQYEHHEEGPAPRNFSLCRNHLLKLLEDVFISSKEFGSLSFADKQLFMQQSLGEDEIANWFEQRTVQEEKFGATVAQMFPNIASNEATIILEQACLESEYIDKERALALCADTGCSTVEIFRYFSNFSYECRTNEFFFKEHRRRQNQWNRNESYPSYAHVCEYERPLLWSFITSKRPPLDLEIEILSGDYNGSMVQKEGLARFLEEERKEEENCRNVFFRMNMARVPEMEKEELSNQNYRHSKSLSSYVEATKGLNLSTELLLEYRIRSRQYPIMDYERKAEILELLEEYFKEKQAKLTNEDFRILEFRTSLSSFHILKWFDERKQLKNCTNAFLIAHTNTLLSENLQYVRGYKELHREEWKKYGFIRYLSDVQFERFSLLVARVQKPLTLELDILPGTYNGYKLKKHELAEFLEKERLLSDF